jgi:hypothetical protein
LGLLVEPEPAAASGEPGMLGRVLMNGASRWLEAHAPPATEVTSVAMSSFLGLFGIIEKLHRMWDFDDYA